MALIGAGTEGLLNHRHNWLQMCLLVGSEGFPLIGRLQVDAEGGDSHQSPLHMNQLPHELPTSLNNHAAGESELAVKPCVPEPAAVSFDVQLEADGSEGSVSA